MSASTKKKLRKEQNAALRNDKQQKAQAEAKKMKITTIVFVAVILAVVLTFAVVTTVSIIKNSGVAEKNTVAATVGENELNSVEFNYYYNDLISNTYNDWYSAYGDNTSAYMSLMGLDMTKPLDEQAYTMGGEEDQTWADYFLESALERAKSDYALSAAATAAGHKMTEAELAEVENGLSNLNFYAMMYGFTDLNQYLKAMYGPGAKESTYKEYCNRSALASSYYNAYNESLTYDDDVIDAYEADKVTDYNSYDYAYYYVNCSKFLGEGTKDDNGGTTYTDEQQETARADAKAAAESLLEAKDIDALNAAVTALSINKGTTTTASKSLGSLGSSISGVYADWLTDSSRKENDIAMFPYESTSTDEDGHKHSTVNGYYVVMFLGMTDNVRPVGNVRHLLVKFEGGTTGENNVTIYSDEEKAAAKAEADGYLKTWQSGDATEESFIELVKKHSDDTSASTGGLFENITPVSQYVTNFLNWSIDETRKAGDTAVIETEYGYHVMYYVGASELNYRDYMIAADMQAEDLMEWYTNLTDAVDAALVDTKHLDTSKVLSAE